LPDFIVSVVDAITLSCWLQPYWHSSTALTTWCWCSC